MAQVTSLSLIGTPGQVHSFGVEEFVPWFVEAIQIGSPVEAVQVTTSVAEDD